MQGRSLNFFAVPPCFNAPNGNVLARSVTGAAGRVIGQKTHFPCVLGSRDAPAAKRMSHSLRTHFLRNGTQEDSPSAYLFIVPVSVENGKREM